MNASSASPSRLLVILFLTAAGFSWLLRPSFAQNEDAAPRLAPAAVAPDGTAANPADASADGTTTGDVSAEGLIADGKSAEDLAAVNKAAAYMETVVWPLVILGIGVAVVLGLIIVFKVNAFIALISAAMVVSLLAPGDISEKISRVAAAFGSSAGGIGIVIAMAAVIGKCMLDSGSADRIVRAFLSVFGEKRAPVALLGSGFVLAVPVFFDTVFYLLVPLARSLHRKTAKDYLKYILAIGAGGAITHTLVPPTPGPLLMADNLGIEVGLMIMIGALVAFPAALAGLAYASIAQRWMQTPMRQLEGAPEPEPLEDSELPSLWLALMPVLLPVVLISTSTVLTTIADAEHKALLTVSDVEWTEFRQDLREQYAAEGPNPSKRLLSQKPLTAPLSTGSAPAADKPAEGEASDETAADKPAGPSAADLLLGDGELSDEQREQVVGAINLVLADRNFYDGPSFFGVPLTSAAKSLTSASTERMKKSLVERRNRAALESAFAVNDGVAVTEAGAIKFHQWDTPMRNAANWSDLFGNANLALLLSTIVAMLTLVSQRGLSRTELSKAVEIALMSGGVIILITAGGGAFGAMLTAAEVGPAIKELFAGIGDAKQTGLAFLFLGFLIASVLKIAQGSSTIAMIVGSSMLAAIIADQTLDFNAVYLATAIGAGSLMGSWMNDSGFWIFAKMGGLTEVEALKSWSVMLVILALTSFGVTVLLSIVMPLI
ncbi:GntP family permease [Lignipirellula cremea]|nr:SLC13 family permease [Lignipirellula cremea]